MAVLKKLAASVIVMAMVFLVVSGSTAAAARPLAGQEWAGGDNAAGDDSVVVRFLRQLYLHKLAGRPGHSCQTYNPNGGC
uniref:Uncharacterized protein n=1 Tax=Oryza brachyantha TaxID=4533 RepID=J3LGW1_ORYBR